MSGGFHLSIEVRALAESVAFFTRVLGGELRHEDARGYVNVEWCGCQITLQQAARAPEPRAGLHFGGNFARVEFDRLAAHVQACAPECIVTPPTVVDAGTQMERTKMYVRCPSGYLIELKGYR